MRTRGRTDRNQEETVRYLRSLGMSVQVLSAVGSGVPDLLVGFRGGNFLVEVKDGAKPPSERKLTKAQEDWHAAWAGDVIVAEDREIAANAVIARVECR